VVFSRLDGKDFTGTAYGEGDTLILLANMSIGGRKQWDPFVVAVDKEKFTTITFDYRSIEDPNPDMDAIFNWLRGEGYHRVICIGASMGTRVCSSVMSQPEMIGVALLAGAVHHASVAQAVYPKLFVSGEDDRWAFDIQEGYKKASDPRTLVIFENNRAHGTDLFKSQDAEAFLKTLLDFVNPLAIP
jgi:alpha/beta superfamily hydrolase